MHQSLYMYKPSILSCPCYDCCGHTVSCDKAAQTTPGHTEHCAKHSPQPKGEGFCTEDRINTLKKK